MVVFFYGTKNKKNTLIIMILINKGVSNNVVLSLTEKCTLAIPVFLFRFVCDLTNIEFTFILPNTSIYKDRYDKFNIIEGSTVTLNNGFYHYYIYEQTSAINLDYTLATTLLEVGKVKVQGTTVTEPVTEFNTSNEYKTFD